MKYVYLIALFCLGGITACNDGGVEISKEQEEVDTIEKASANSDPERRLLDAISSASIDLKSGEIAVLMNEKTREMRIARIDDIAFQQFTVALFELNQGELNKLGRTKYTNKTSARIEGMLGYPVTFGIRNRFEEIGYVSVGAFSYDLVLAKLPKDQLEKFIHGSYEPEEWISLTDEEELSEAMEVFLQEL